MTSPPNSSFFPQCDLLTTQQALFHAPQVMCDFLQKIHLTFEYLNSFTYSYQLAPCAFLQPFSFAFICKDVSLKVLCPRIGQMRNSGGISFKLQ